MRLGLDLRRLGTSELTYRRLRVVLEYAPRESAYVREIGGETVEWSSTEHLLALVCDELAVANWQRSGGKGRYPKPLTRPGETQTTVPAIRGDLKTIAELRAVEQERQRRLREEVE